MFWITIIVFVLAIIGYIVIFKRHFKYWIDRGVTQATASEAVKATWNVMSRNKCIAESIQDRYNMFSKLRYAGSYDFTTPTLFIRDPGLIKLIGVKDFDHFINHEVLLPEDIDPLWPNNLFALKDEKWREMRSTLSPAFTSSKMKYMFGLILESAQQFSHYFAKQKEDLITVEMKDILTRFTNDVIASTAFGIQCDSLADRKNEFYQMGTELNDVASFFNMIKFLLYSVCPQISKVFRFSFFSARVSNFFIKIVKENIASRERDGIVRPDMINLLMEARKNGLKYEENQKDQNEGFATVEESHVGKSPKAEKVELTDLAITAQALIFFLAGFDSVSAQMCFMSYELAVNTDIQERLRQEVDDTFESCNGKLTYEALQSMKYLDMVVSETLRKWPVTPGTDRVCSKTYVIHPSVPGEKAVTIEKGVIVFIPIFGLHRDPKYYSDPERFDPERFSDENKKSINPYAYLPFGVGPRNCIGSRFALLETKALFFHLLVNFEIVPVEKTQIPLKLSPKSFNLAPEKGIWLGLKRRNIPTCILN